MRLVPAAITLAAFMLTALGQTPAPPVNVTSRIEGTVFRSSSNEPIRGARVTLTRMNAATLESFGYFDPELLKQSESQGKALHIIESSKLSQDIRSIRPAP